MATKRKKTARKKATKRKASKRPKGALARLEAELPKTLRDYVKRVERGISGIEKRLEKAGTGAQKRALRAVRDAGRQLGRLEERGEAAWARLTVGARKEALSLIEQLEAAIAPKATARRKKAARRRKKATKRA
jgi:hypothetical protein